MNYRSLTVALQCLKSRPLRSFLTVVSLVIGVLSIIIVSASGSLAGKALIAQEERQAGRAPTYMMQIPPEDSSVETVLGNSLVTNSTWGVAAVIDTDAQLATRDDPRVVNVQIHAGHLPSIKSLKVISGTWPHTSDALSPLLVVNEAMLQEQGNQEYLISLGKHGQEVKATLVGVVQDGSPDPRIYLRYKHAKTWWPEHTHNQSAYLLLHSHNSTTAIANFESVFSSMGVSFESFRRYDETELLKNDSASIQLIFTFLAFTSLFVGALGVLNIGLASVNERVDEFALRRAVGYRKSQLRVIVLFESAITGLASGLFALLLSLPLLNPASRLLFPMIDQTHGMDFPAFAAALGIAASCLASVIGGLYPATKASLTPIATVMRA